MVIEFKSLPKCNIDKEKHLLQIFSSVNSNTHTFFTQNIARAIGPIFRITVFHLPAARGCLSIPPNPGQ